MTEDEVLIERIRPLLDGRAGFSEKKMFGGVCFLINGNMCLGTGWEKPPRSPQAFRPSDCGTSCKHHGP